MPRKGFGLNKEGFTKEMSEYIESDYGEISLNTNPKAYDKVKINISSNSGYELASIIVKDSEENIIDVTNNEFIMPPSDVTIEAIFDSKIDNPETIDYIFIILGLGILSSIFIYKAYKRLKWLR